MTTPNDTIVADKELLDPERIKQDDTRFEELKKKDAPTPEEQKELGEIKERYGKRMQKKIDKLHYEAKTAKEETEKERQRREELEQEVIELREKANTDRKIDIDVSGQVVEIAGKKYYTDDALLAMINSKKITEADAVKYQKERDREETFVLWEERQKKKEQEKEAVTTRKKDADWVNQNYPLFNKNNPDFNPEDPLYKQAVELYTEVYAARPDGLSLAIKRAKQILRIPDNQPDITNDLSLESSETPPREKRGKEKEITLTEAEKEWGIRMYCRGDVINPKTKAPYTEQEAIAKTLEAKKRRAG